MRAHRMQHFDRAIIIVLFLAVGLQTLLLGAMIMIKYLPASVHIPINVFTYTSLRIYYWLLLMNGLLYIAFQYQKRKGVTIFFGYAAGLLMLISGICDVFSHFSIIQVYQGATFGQGIPMFFYFSLPTITMGYWPLLLSLSLVFQESQKVKTRIMLMLAVIVAISTSAFLLSRFGVVSLSQRVDAAVVFGTSSLPITVFSICFLMVLIGMLSDIWHEDIMSGRY